MYVTITCKYDTDLIKNSWEKVATPFIPIISLWDFSNAQGQLTLQSVVGSGRISNSSELLCMSSLPGLDEKQPRKSGNVDLFRRSIAGNSVVQGPIWPNFEFM